MRSENHPYLMGALRFIKHLFYRNKPNESGNDESQIGYLLLIGEFGEELRGGIRIDLVRSMWDPKDLGKPVLPVDVGLDVLLTDYWEVRQERHDPQKTAERYKFWCAICEEFQPLTNIDYERYGHDEAIFFICQTCKKAAPRDVKETRMRHLYEIGRDLIVAPDIKSNRHAE